MVACLVELPMQTTLEWGLPCCSLVYINIWHPTIGSPRSMSSEFLCASAAVRGCRPWRPSSARRLLHWRTRRTKSSFACLGTSGNGTVVATHLSERSYELVTELSHGHGRAGWGEDLRRRWRSCSTGEHRSRGARRPEGAANAAERRLQRRQGMWDDTPS
jgi:hypothetical protein